jgi:ubiquinone/menaquinone biosynthesis C-methylase UbiE
MEPLKENIIKEYSARVEIENESERDRDLRVDIPRKWIQKYIQPRDEVLDAGGGTGLNAMMMAKQCRHVVLMDLTPAILAKAKENIAHVTNISSSLGDVTRIPFSSETFHLTVCLGDAISYVLDQREQAFDELVRVTRQNGILIIGCNSKYGFIRRKLAENDVTGALEIYRTSQARCVMGPKTHLYTVAEGHRYLQERGCRILSTSSTLTFVDSDKDIPDNEWEELISHELAQSREAEWLGGEHLIFIARKM